MRKLLITALVVLCAACADTGNTASTQDIHASRFIYDAAAKPIVVAGGGKFIYDASAPELHASRFVVENNQ